MSRGYTMRKRGELRDRTREQIIRATMQLHDRKGVAPTTFSDIAEQAGVGIATVFRHFPTRSDLVRACGGHVWQEMQPPVPGAAAAVFIGARTTRQRLARLVAEVDSFYQRGALRLGLASRDRELVPELDQFLRAVEAGVEALVREAMVKANPSTDAMKVAIALTSFPVWAALKRTGLPSVELLRLHASLLQHALRAA